MRRLTYVVVGLLLCAVCCSFAAAQTQRNKATTFRRVEPNLYAPELYADQLQLKFTLVNLPGAEKTGSNWEVTYKLYFVSEADFNKALEPFLKREGGYKFSELPPLPGKIVLSQGSFKSGSLKTLKDRIKLVNDVAFKAKVPDEARTKFARVITDFSVKVYDAQLKTNIYHSGFFMTRPFDDQNQQSKAVPRTVIYTSFFVSPKGELFASQWARDDTDMGW